jgi:L-threonylcarbamoyladenylate synthase
MLIKLDTEDNLKIGLKKAADSILSGGVVAIPTESFYGLAVNATNSSAIQRLLDVKERSGDQPILILIPSVEQLDQYVILIPDIARLLMNEFWPGGLTLIFEAKPNLPRELTAGSPITATSANISGQPACSSAKEVFQYLGESVDLILDGGKTAGGKGSTVLDVTIDPPVVVREGMVSWEKIKKCLK